MKSDLYGRISSKKPYVNKINRRKRLKCAKNYQEKPLGFSNKMFWSDESKFNLLGSDGKAIAWRSPKRSSHPSAPYPLSNMVVVMSSTGIAFHCQVWVT